MIAGSDHPRRTGVAGNSTPGLVIAAPASGSGKTTLTLPLIAALRRRGRILQAYISGADYMHPAFHATAAGRAAFTPASRAPVRDGFAANGIRVFGAIGRDSTLTMPERHLGLVQAQEDSALAARLAALADLVERDIDLAALQAAACPTRRRPHTDAPRLVPPGQRIALARDVAFSFIYPHLLAGWRAAGAEIIPFSPLADEPPDPSCDVAWLPGGYPELHAGKLAAASRFADGIRAFAQTRPVHGECGGYMTLGAGLIDAAGNRHAMLGLLGLETDFAQRRLHLGYRTPTLLAPIPGHTAGRALP